MVETIKRICCSCVGGCGCSQHRLLGESKVFSAARRIPGTLVRSKMQIVAFGKYQRLSPHHGWCTLLKVETRLPTALPRKLAQGFQKTSPFSLNMTSFTPNSKSCMDQELTGALCEELSQPDVRRTEDHNTVASWSRTDIHSPWHAPTYDALGVDAISQQALLL